MAIIHATNETFEDEVLKSDKPVLVDFYADWCGPCKMLSPIVEQLEEEYSDKIKVVKINIDNADKIASDYSVMSIPTLIFFKSGQDVKKTIGIQSKEKLIEEFQL